MPGVRHGLFEEGAQLLEAGRASRAATTSAVIGAPFLIAAFFAAGTTVAPS